MFSLGCGVGSASAALWTVWPGCILCLAQQFCLFSASMDHGTADLAQNKPDLYSLPISLELKVDRGRAYDCLCKPMSVWSNTSECRVRRIPCSKCWVCLKTREGLAEPQLWLRVWAPVHFARSPRAAPWLIKSSSLNIKHHNKVKHSCCLGIVRLGPFATERLSSFSAPKREMSFSRPVFVKPSQCNNETMRWQCRNNFTSK